MKKKVKMSSRILRLVSPYKKERKKKQYFHQSYIYLLSILDTWYVLINDSYSEACIPTHPCLKLISNSEQELTEHSSRRLITMEKISEYISEEAQVHKNADNFRTRYFQAVKARMVKNGNKCEPSHNCAGWLNIFIDGHAICDLSRPKEGTCDISSGALWWLWRLNGPSEANLGCVLSSPLIENCK